MKLKNFICYQGVLLGECMTFNQGVTGSNPVGLTTFFVRLIRKTYPFQQNLVHQKTRESEPL
jgi:hypothetical protein